MTYKELFEIAAQQFLNGKISEEDFIVVVKMVAKKITPLIEK